MTPTVVLAGDIGGTHARFARVAAGAGAVAFEQQQTYDVRGSASLETLVQRYLADHPGPITAAAIGIAAPIVGGKANPINLPWAVDEAEVRSAIGSERGYLLNDLLANAWGIGELGPDQFEELQPDRIGLGGNRAVCSAGTGLGIAGMVAIGDTWHPFSSEGGHIDYGPRDADEDALLVWLRAHEPDWEHVSAERIVSGPGIHAIWTFLTATDRATPTPDLLAAMHAGDPSAAISHAALADTDKSAVLTLEYFARAYGAQAGNLALVLLSTGGMYIGGGIAPRILPFLRRGGFLDAFHAKGRYNGLLEQMAVRVILDDHCALRGAARFALTSLDG
ncbi:MAG: glucokinase [Thermoleophilia bacterium]|jgi:glucokinase